MNSLDSTLEDFDKRLSEVDAYLEFLDSVLSTDAEIVCKDDNGVEKRSPVSGDIQKILKSAVFLMLYNVVESGITKAFDRVYEQVSTRQLGYLELDDAYRELWIEQKFQELTPTTANYDSFKNRSSTLVKEVAEGTPLKFRSSLPIAGNIDAKLIRELFQKHGALLRKRSTTMGGSDLLTIKNKRNQLGHGELTFTEVGRDYSLSDLLAVRVRAMKYARGALLDLRSHLSWRGYELR